MSKKDAASENTEVAVVAGGQLAPAFMDDSMFGAGFEGMDNESFAIPFIQILQKMSPIVDPDDPKYIEGARAGMLLNTVTNKLYDGKSGLVIVPCYYKRSYLRWGGRESTEPGFKGELTVEEVNDMMKDESKIKVVEGRLYAPNPDGTVHEKKNDYFADTRAHYVLVIDPDTGEYGRALLSLSSTQIKASKMLNTALQQKKIKDGAGNLRTPPTFANMVRLTTIGQSNDKGAWSGARFDLEGIVSDKDIFNEAVAFYKDISAGQVQVDYNKQAESAHTEAANHTPQDAEQF
ncbi:hypothetical protein TROPICALSUN_51 [Erwinia phage vB_EamM_TropicalSun]|uniref:Uncharacterized protein n=3 Tax=Myosmarvirus TaxID=2843428 RepID=A0A5B9NQJ3_9CAUD|nr:hypothetical protein HWC56_gp044 [Serratia phage MyoSmar]QEG09493.1 hypothetical protein CPT_MyoSmar_044 [Serratia phage MyoSmar]QEG13841.1 hypothetical protein TROPICALSUN_51 [Erwinia phage vB_EamM_TropicalSun]